MNGAAVDVQNNMITVVYILMYHLYPAFLSTLPEQFTAMPCDQGTSPALTKIALFFALTHNKQRLVIAAYDSAYSAILLFCLLTGLVSHCAGSLACRLAGSLALAASALLHGFLQISCV